MKQLNLRLFSQIIIYLSLLLLSIVLFSRCSNASSASIAEAPVQSLPVLTVGQEPVITYSQYNASIEGSKDIEIHPQVDGILNAILVDEGAYVHKGQSLFVIDAQPYQQQLNTAKAGLLAANASLQSAQININKITPLVKNNVVSDITLKSAQASYQQAEAMVSQAKAEVAAARINVGYTTITAPTDGYIGKIPFKAGSLVGRSSLQALTTISATKQVHVYFSMSERDFMQFKENYKGSTIEEKIKNMGPVSLILSNDSVYAQKGVVEMVEGQFDKNTGSIDFRANFPNPDGLLRSGNTGKIRLGDAKANSLIIPQESTFELQNKVFVYTLGDSNKVSSQRIDIASSNGRYYVVKDGLKSGDKIVFSGMDRLNDGAIIKPYSLSMDSILLANPIP